MAGNGWMILGDSAGFLNSARLKGIHLAIKSGMLAAETAYHALMKNDSSAATLGDFQKKVESSWIKEELWKVRNLHQGFEHGMYAGMFHTGLQMITGGRGLRNRYPARPGYENMRKLSEIRPMAARKPISSDRPRATASLRSISSPTSIIRERSTKKISQHTSSFTTPTSAIRAA